MYLMTYSGKRFDFTDIESNTIDITDIAHALSMTCRYGGHVSRFYSVAEHSFLISQYIMTRFKPKRFVLDEVDGLDDSRFVRMAAFAALLHDASEAYLCDMPQPCKSSIGMSDYQYIENEISKHINKVLGIPDRFMCVVKQFDSKIVVDEMNALFPGGYPEEGEGLGVSIGAWTPALAKQMFLEQYLLLHRIIKSFRDRFVH